MPVRRCSLALVVSVLWLGACDVPNFQGPQIQVPPPAFSMNRETSQERRMFPDRPVVYHDAWVEASWGNFSGIYINGHSGVLGKSEVEAAQLQAIAAVEGTLVDIGPLEALNVDGRTAWGWGETWRLANGGLQYVVFRAAVPYDTVTYAVEFLTGDPGLKIRPDSLRTVVASFAVGRTRLNVPLLVISVGVALLLLNLARSRARERERRARSMPLVKVPKRTDADPGGEGNAPTSVADAVRRKIEEGRSGGTT